MKYEAKKYSWGYTLWIVTRFGKKQVANKLKDKKAIREFIDKYTIVYQ